MVGTSLAAFQTHCQHVIGGLVSEASASRHYRTFSPTLSRYCWQTQQCVCLVTARELPLKNPNIPHRSDCAQHILMQLSCATSCVDILLISARSKCGQAAGHQIQRLNPTTPNFNLWLTSHFTSPYEIVIKNLGKKKINMGIGYDVSLTHRTWDLSENAQCFIYNLLPFLTQLIRSHSK